MMVRTVCSAVQCTVLCSTMRTSQDDCLLCEEVKVEGKEAAVCCKYACSVGDCADIVMGIKRDSLQVQDKVQLFSAVWSTEIEELCNPSDLRPPCSLPLLHDDWPTAISSSHQWSPSFAC